MRKHAKRPKSSSRTKTADAILCADLHLRSKRPVGRNDDFRSSMIAKLMEIDQLQKTHACPVLCAGDIFDRWKATPDLLTIAERFLPDNMIAIPGQHDLPTHSFDRFSESALFHLYFCGHLEIPLPDYTGPMLHQGRHTEFFVRGFPFGEDLFTPEGYEDRL